MKAICFFDVDDTLVPFGLNDIREQEKKILNQLLKNGHYVFVNTGRTRSFIPSFLLDFPFSGYAAGCGTYIEINHQLKHFYEFNQNTGKEIIKDLQKYNLSAILEGHSSNAFIHETNHPVMEALQKVYKKQNITVSNPSDENCRFSKFNIFPNENGDIDTFIKKYESSLEFISRHHNFYEVTPKDYSKGTAVTTIANDLNIPIENCYCFGDSTNDLSMLQAVKHSIVMGNGDEKAKEIAEFVTHDCADDGIEYACKHYGLI